MKVLKDYIRLFVAVCVMIMNNLYAQKSAYVSVSGYQEIGTPSFLNTVDGGVTFNIGNYVAVGAGINVCKFWDNHYSSLGVGAGPVLQIFALKGNKIKLFIEGKGDVMYMFPEHPETAINFTGYFGPFAEFTLNEKNGLRLGACYNHFSNGKGSERATNPSWDAFGFNVGWVFH